MPAPTGAEPRLAAARALAGVLDAGRALETALAPLLAGLSGSRDRAQARRLAHAVLRDWPALDFLVSQQLRKPLRRRDRLAHFLLVVGVSELRAGREPAPAVVHACVEAAATGGMRHLRGLVNAVLRSYPRRAQSLQAEIDTNPVRRHGYPGWLIEAVRADWPGDWQAVLAAGNRPPPLTLRVNRRYWHRDRARAALAAAGYPARAGDAADALVLERRAAIRDLPGFADGGLSVQDTGAQRAIEFMHLKPGLRVLDACAAPGGKSAHILEAADVDLVAVDADRDRLARVGETLARLKLGATLMAADAADPDAWWDGRGFDRILIDAPCSATGVIRRHPDIRWLRRAGDIAELARLQARMLGALWPLLSPGGILVYATCSVLRAENTQPVQAFLEHHADAEPIDHASLPGRALACGRQLLPGDGDGDGFYYAAFGRLPTGAG